MKQFNPHRESRMPPLKLGPVPRRSVREKSKKRIPSDAKTDTDSDSSSITKAMSPIELENGMAEQGQAQGQLGVVVPARPAERLSRNPRNNLHVLGERLNIDAQQLRDMVEGEGDEVMEMPVLRTQRNARNLDMGQGPVEGILQTRTSPFDDTRAPTTPTIRVQSPDEKDPGVLMTRPSPVHANAEGDTDSIDSLPYAQPSTQIEPQP